MAQLVITIPDAQVPRVLQALEKRFPEQIGIIGPETDAQFAQRMIRNFLIHTVQLTESFAQSEIAKQQAIDAVTNSLSALNLG